MIGDDEKVESKSLKVANFGFIWVYAVTHLVLAYTVLFQDTLTHSATIGIGQVLGGSAVGAVFVAIVVEVITGEGKARLVFLRWSFALPGHRAFTIYIHEDPRIDKARLTGRHGPFPSREREQNALWYRLLHRNREIASVGHAHGRYLFLRDLTWIALLLLGVTLLVTIRMGAWSPPGAILLTVMAVEFVLLRWMAAQSGRSLVKAVLAVESARDD